MRFKTFICGFAVIYPFVLFGFVQATASEKQSSHVDPNLKDTQQYLKGELLINNPVLNHLPNVGPNYLAQATTFVGEPIVVQDEIKVLGKAPDTPSDKIDILPKIKVTKNPDQFTVSILKEFSLGYVPRNKGSSHHVHYDESNNGESHHYESHGPTEYTSHSYGGPEDISGSTNSESFKPSPPIQDFIDQSSYSSSQNSNQNDNSYYNAGDSSQQFQSEGGYDNQQQSNGGYDGGQSDLSGGYDGGSQQQSNGGYDQGGQSGGFSLGQAQQQLSTGGYDDLGGQQQQQQISGGYDQGEVQQQQPGGGYDQGQILQQQSVGGYDQGQNLQQQSVGGYDQGQIQQPQLTGGYNQQESLQLQQPIGGYAQAPVQQQQQQIQVLTGGYNQPQQQQEQQSNNGGYNQQESVQQQSIVGYNQQQTINVGGYDQVSSQQNQQQNNGGYDQGQQDQEQQSNGGYNNHNNNNNQGSSYQQQNSAQQTEIIAQAIHNNVGKSQEQLIKSLGLDSIIQQANLVFKSEQLLNRPTNAEQDTVQNPGNDNSGQYGAPASQSQTDAQNPNNQYGAPAQNVNNQYGEPAQNVNNQYEAPAQNVNNQYGAPSPGKQNNVKSKQHQSGVLTPAVMDGWIPMRPIFSRTHYTKGGNQGNKDNIWNSKLAAVATNEGQSSKSSQGGYSENNNAQSQAGRTHANRIEAVLGGYSGNNNAQSQGGYSGNNNAQSQGGYSGNNNAQSQGGRTNAIRVQAVQAGYSVDSNQAQSSQIKDFQVNNLVLDKSGVLQSYDTNKAAKVIIHAQNVIIKSDIPVEKASVSGHRDITPLLQQQLRTLIGSQVKDSSITAKTNAFIPTPNYFKPSPNPQPLVILNNNNNGGQSGGYNAPIQGGGYNLAASIIQATAFTNNNNVALPPQDYGAGLQPPLPYAPPSVQAPSPSSPPNDYGAGLQPPLPYAPPPILLGAASNPLQNVHFVLPAQTTIPLPPLPQGPVGLVVGQFQGPPTPNNNPPTSRPPNDYHTGLYAPPPFSHNNNNNNNNNNNRGRGNRIPEGKIAGDPVKISGSQNNVKVLSPNVDINIKAKGNKSPPRFKSSDKPGADYGSSVAYSSDVGKLQESSTEKVIVQSESVVQADNQFPFALSPEKPGKALPTFFGANAHPFAYLATSTKRPLVYQGSSKFRYKPAKRPSLFSISFGNPSQLESTPGPVYVGPTLRVPRPGPGRFGNKTRNSKTVYKLRSKPQPTQFTTEFDDSFFEASVDNKVKSRPNKPNVSHDDFETTFKYLRGRGIPRRPTSSDSSEQSGSGYSIDFGDPYTRLGKDLFYGVYDILKKNTPSFQTIATMPRSIMSTMNKIKIPPVQLQFYRVR